MSTPLTMNSEELLKITQQFLLDGTVGIVEPLGNGLINDTFRVVTEEPDMPDYVLQRINKNIFTDVALLQRNIEIVTSHLRKKLLDEGISDIDRRVLRFINSVSGKSFFFDGENYWRTSVYIPDTITVNQVTPQTSYDCGRAFGHFQQQLIDLDKQLGETIPDFHNMELRLRQLRRAVKNDLAGRAKEVAWELAFIEDHAEEMCTAERLHRKGLLPKRVCHCDTKVNNILFDRDGKVLCIIDLDTVMPAFVFSDYGDFLRTAASTQSEDSPEFDRIEFRWDIFEAFTSGYLESTSSFLTPVERKHLPYAAALFPMMQAVRFLTDYLDGDKYYKISYPEHNITRARNQLRYFQKVEGARVKMASMVNG